MIVQPKIVEKTQMTENSQKTPAPEPMRSVMKQPGAMRHATIEGALALPAGVKLPKQTFSGINPATLEGLVIDFLSVTLR